MGRVSTSAASSAVSTDQTTDQSTDPDSGVKAANCGFPLYGEEILSLLLLHRAANS